METVRCPNGCCIIKIKPYIMPNNFFKKIHNRTKRKAGVFIYDPVSTKVLLVQSRGNFWGLPKGSLQFGENDTDCAIREVKEETGLVVSKEDFTKMVKINNNTVVYFYMEMPECEVSVQDNIIDNDANAIGWLKPDCIDDLIKNDKILLNKHCHIVFYKFHSRKF